jgi:hypothetical protein
MSTAHHTTAKKNGIDAGLAAPAAHRAGPPPGDCISPPDQGASNTSSGRAEHVIASLASRCSAIARAAGYRFGANADLLGSSGRGDLAFSAQLGQITCQLLLRTPGTLPEAQVKQAIKDTLRAQIEQTNAGQTAEALQLHARRLADARSAVALARTDLADGDRARSAIAALDRALAGLPAQGEMQGIPVPSPDALGQERERLAGAKNALVIAQGAYLAACRKHTSADPLAEGAGDVLLELAHAADDAKKRLAAASELQKTLEPRVADLEKQYRAGTQQALTGMVGDLAAKVQQERTRVIREMLTLLAEPLAVLAVLETAAGLLMAGSGSGLAAALATELAV